MSLFVIQHKATKYYLKTKDAWSWGITDDLQQARVYTGSGPAKNSLNSRGRYNRTIDRNDYEVVPVTLSLKPT